MRSDCMAVSALTDCFPFLADVFRRDEMIDFAVTLLLFVLFRCEA